jgi:hypothetical protein
MATVQERSFVDRLIGVATLDTATFEEIEHDESATVWAAVIAILAGISFGVGVAIGELAFGWGEAALLFIFQSYYFAVFGLGCLALFTTTAYLVGGKLLKTEATEVTWTELFRTLGFAGIPLVALGWLLAMPFEIVLLVALGWLLATGWFLAAVVVAVRQALDFSTGRAIVTALVAFIVVLMPMIPIVALVLGAE